MNKILFYFISVTAAAMIGVLAGNITKDGTIKQIVRILSGLLLLVVLLQPIKQFEPQSIQNVLQDRVWDEEYQKEYEDLYQQRLREYVAKTTEEYIAAKGEELGLILTVTVELTDETYPVPYKAEIRGSMDLRQLEELQAYVTDKIGIRPENQRWRIYD